MKKHLQGIMKKNNTWNIRRLDNETIIPATQWPSVLYSAWATVVVSVSYCGYAPELVWIAYNIHLNQIRQFSYKISYKGLVLS